jgi:hypothetical protein
VTWSGKHRAALTGQGIYPRPLQNPLPIWVGVGGSPESFVRAGTLDTPEAVCPDVHIFTRSKVPWLELPEGVRAFKDAYKIDEVWTAESKERLRLNVSRPM